MIILAIPIYYQVSAYISYPHTPHYPTTTAEYIALPPSVDSYIAVRNHAIAKDAVSWGWHVYDVDENSPKMEAWWAGYGAAAKEESWDDDIWRIWQREHGFRIARGQMNDVDNRKDNPRKVRIVNRGMKKFGQWVHRSREAAELELRQLEERKRTLRDKRKRARQENRKRDLPDKARKKRGTAEEANNDSSSEISLPGSFIGRLQAWKDSVAKAERNNQFKLTHHPWLSQR